MDYVPKMTLFIPEAHTLFILVHGLSIGMPAEIETYLVGFCFNPAEITFPKITSSTY